MRAFHPLWCVSQKGFDPKSEKHYEGAFTQGSGYFHLRGSYEEGLPSAIQDEAYMRMPANVTVEKPHSPLSKFGTYIPGITGIHPLLNEEIVNLPYPAVLHIWIDGKSVSMEDTGVKEFRRWLDLRDGVLHRQWKYTTTHGAVVEATFVRYVCKAYPSMLIQQACFSAAAGECELVIENDVDERVRTNGYNHFLTVEKKTQASQILLAVETDNGDRVHIASEMQVDGQRCAHLVRHMYAGQSLRLEKRSIFSTSRDAAGLKPLGELSDGLWVQSGETMYKLHDDRWQKLWQMADVEITGDDAAQLALRFSIYHLLRCANEADERIAVCAKGFSSEAYFGHFFWDSEIYLQPFYLHTIPQVGKNLSLFRVNTLAGAMRNAARHNSAGARYPWESSVTGEEQCPNWQYADHEIHVTADVAFGIWNTWKTTGDNAFLEQSFPVLRETARYWLSRVYRKADGSYHVNGVMGPDEYICICNDNAYTNAMVREALRYTLEAAEWLMERGQMPQMPGEELKQMQDVIDHLYMPSENGGIIPQCEHFDTMYEEPDFQSDWPDRTIPYGQAVSQDKNYRTKALKQADVLMLFFLFPERFSKIDMLENYLYYSSYTTHDSSLSAVVHAIVASWLGREEESYGFFQKAMQIDLNNHGAGEGVHIANCAGLWQAVIYGFCGLGRCYESHWNNLHPCLPEHWKKVRFRIAALNRCYEVTVDQGKVAWAEV